MSHSFIVVDGVRLHVGKEGSGEPLLLIHGLGGPLMWQRVVEPLSAHFQVVVPALPGFGESDGTRREYTAAEHAAILREALEQLGIKQATVLGISYGGQVAAEFASRYSDIAKRLVLVCPTGLLKTPLVVSNAVLRFCFRFIARHFLLTNEKRLCKKGERSFYNLANRPPDLCRKFYEQLMKLGHREAWLNAAKNSLSGGEQFRKVLAGISIPTLILWGENDKTVPLSHAYEFQQLIPTSQLQTFKECAHSVPMEKVEEFCRVVKAFCV